MNTKPSILRNLLITFLFFGASVGVIFPFYAEFFVKWKPGMYGWFFMGCIIAGLIIGIVNYFLVKIMLLSKLKRIADIAQAISNKDIRHSCDIISHDVIGDIVNSFNVMTQTLRDMITHINDEAEQLYGASESLDSLTADASDSSQQQQREFEQVATAMNEMSATAQEVARSAEETAIATKEANEQGNNAKVVVVEAMSSVDVLAEMVGTAADVITNLERDSEKIGEVLSVITGIAQQTNLLALNAAIESARAGEHGRGFAVVADEVRTLATRTQQSTEEIGVMIEHLQAGSRKAVETMELGRTQAQQGVNYTEQAAEALAMISGNVNTINEMSTQIACAAEQQSTVVEDVNKNVVSINESSVLATESLTKVNLASANVARLSGELRDLVTGYQV